MRTMAKKKMCIWIFSLICMLCLIFGVSPLVQVQAAEIEPTGKVELYQLAPSENLYEGYVIKTSNGELIVVDGGASTGGNPNYIDAVLTAISGKEDYTVKYWFLSHAHSDHIYELAKLLNSETIDFTIENFVFDFPNFIAGSNASGGADYVADFSNYCNLGGDYTAWNMLREGLTNYATQKAIDFGTESATYYDYLNGRVVNEAALANGPMYIEIDNVEIEVLQTYSTRDTQVNSNSMIFRLWADGQSVMFLNDATVESGNRLIETYGREYLKSDIVQMAHHGQNGTAKNVYDAINAKVRLWPCFRSIWENANGGYQINEVRSWVGLPELASDFVQTDYDLVAGLCETPTDVTSVSAWEAVLDGMKMELPYLPVYERTFVMQEGAGIRLTAGSTGIRFIATLVTYDKDTEYGFVIAPRAALDRLNVTKDYAKSLIEAYGTGDDGVLKMQSAVHQVDGHFEIKGSIANILPENINLEFIGIAYAYKDGVYTDAYIPELDSITRNVAKVAAGAYNDALYNTESGYDSDDKKIMEGFLNTSTSNAEYTLAFANATETLSIYESKTLSIESNVDTLYAKWTSDNESVAIVEDGVVTAVGLGSAKITVTNAGKEATCMVNSVAETDALVSFSGKGSEEVATFVPSSIRESRRAGLIESEWLESYQGADGVLKVTAKAGASAPYVADIRLELPVAITEGATVRYYVEDNDSKFIYFYDGSSDHSYDNLKTIVAGKTLPEYAKNVWSTAYVSYSSVTDDNKALNILIQGGSANFEHVIYFDIIEEGDTTANYSIGDSYAHITAPLAAELTGKYLADFSSDEYERLVIDDTYGGGHVAEKVEAERLESYDGASNVMKITTYNNSSTFGDFTMVLPKAMGTTGYTIRFMIESTTSTGTALRILNPRTEVDKIKEYSYAGILGKWQEVFVPYTGIYNQEITFQIWGNADGVNVFYIDYVADGDCVAEMEAARKDEQLGLLAESLTGDYLADFSSSAYTYTVGYSSYSANIANSITTEYLSTYADANGSVDNGVLKITAKAQSNGRGNIVINLPKESTSGTITVKFMVPECNSTYNGFIDPGTNASLISSQFAVSTTWQYLVLNQASCEKDCIEFLFANGGAVTNTVYIAAVMEGDQVAYLKAEALKAVKEALAVNLADGVLADFSSVGYAQLATKSETSPNIASSVTAEYLESYTDANGAMDNGVLKVTSVNNGSKRGNIRINLPKTSESGQMTVKFMVEAGSTTMWFVDPGTNGATDIKTIANGSTSFTTSTVWQVMTLNQASYEHDCIELLFANSSSTNVVYFACIMEGDATKAIQNEIDDATAATTRAALAENLTDNYLADFSSADYCKLVYASNQPAREAAAITAEHLNLHNGETNVLKITTTNNSLKVGDFKLLLPKSGETGSITVKIMVAQSDATAIRFLQPDTTNGAYLEDNSTIANITVSDTQWQTMTLYYNNISNRDQLDIMFAGGTAGSTNVIYIAYVIDGAGDTTPASALFDGNEKFILFADKPPQGDATRIATYADAGFTDYVITEDQRSLFVKDSTTGEYTVDENGNYILNTEYLGFINNAIKAGMNVIMRNMGNKPDYFDLLTAEQIATLQALIDGYYMCDEPSHIYKSNYTDSTYVEALASLVEWYNANGKDENGEYTLFHVNLLQSYGIEELLHKNDGVTFEEYVANYVETILKNVNGTKTISTDYYALATGESGNYVKSDFLRNLYVIANAAKQLKAEDHDVITNFCVQLCNDTGLNLRLMESIEDVRFQTALYAAFGATSFEYYGYVGYMYNQTTNTTNSVYDYVKTVNGELQNLAKAISLFDWNGYQFLSAGQNTVTGIDGTQMTSFNALTSVASTADAVVSEFVCGEDYAYMAVNYTEPSLDMENTITFTLNGETAATVFINGVRTDVEIVNNTYTVTLNAGDYVFIYPYN